MALFLVVAIAVTVGANDFFGIPILGKPKDDVNAIIDNLIKEITDEYQMITVINTHDMNSVMEIGEKIIFLKDGLKVWEGSSQNIFKTDNEAVTNFVYSSNLFKKVREVYIKDN